MDVVEVAAARYPIEDLRQVNSRSKTHKSLRQIVSQPGREQTLPVRVCAGYGGSGGVHGVVQHDFAECKQLPAVAPSIRHPRGMSDAHTIRCMRSRGTNQLPHALFPA